MIFYYLDTGMEESTTSSSNWDDVFGSFDTHQTKKKKKKLPVRQWHQTLGAFAVLPKDVVLYILTFLIVPMIALKKTSPFYEHSDEESQMRTSAHKAQKSFNRLIYQPDMVRMHQYRFWHLKMRPLSYCMRWLIRFMQTCTYAKHLVLTLRRQLGHAQIMHIEQKMRWEIRHRSRDRKTRDMAKKLAQQLIPVFTTFVQMRRSIPYTRALPIWNVFTHPIKTGQLESAQCDFADIFKWKLTLYGKFRVKNGIRSLISLIKQAVRVELYKLYNITGPIAIHIMYEIKKGACLHSQHGCCPKAHCKHVVWMMRIEFI